MEKRIEIGNAVVFIDEHRVEHNALITAVHGNGEASQYLHGPKAYCCVNLLLVCDDESRTDQYGRQIDRHPSVVHWPNNSARAMCWRFADEDMQSQPE